MSIKIKSKKTKASREQPDADDCATLALELAKRDAQVAAMQEALEDLRTHSANLRAELNKVRLENSALRSALVAHAEAHVD